MGIKQFITGMMLGLAIMPAQATLNVFACEPEWGHLVRILVPDANIHTATTAWQDPHYIEARPSLIAAMRRSDIAVCTGASLEAGWLPALINRASNRDIQPGKPGLFFAAEQVTLHQPHDHVDRSMGDVHPEGDPHIHLDPERVALVAGALAERLASIAPEQANGIQLRERQWQVRWKLQRQQWRAAAADLAGLSLVVQHSSFGYMLRWLGVESAIDLEPKPGLPPSAAHLTNVLADPALDRVNLILVAAYQDDRPARWLSERTGLPVVVMPTTLTGETGIDSLGALISQLIERFRQHSKAPANNETTNDV
jgi:zinc/manganese transport system substrate-binding protein